MTSKLRLRDFIGLILLVGSGVVGVGCSSTSGSRFRPAEGARSVASVGDQPMPPSVGSPGSQVAADVPDPEPYRNPKARISGRVVDDQGRPVSGATVRLADGSSKAGRDLRATTDPSGGFTLGNLRPGSEYHLVAEANFGDDQGTVTGRATADTSETGVQIRLGDASNDATPVRRSRRKSSKAQTISERVDGEIKPASPRGVNAEDLGPPAEAADLVEQPEPRKSKKPKSAPTDSQGSDAASGWRRPGADSESKPAPETEAQPDAEQPLNLDPGAGARPSSGRPRRSKESEDDEANPLPLALPPEAKASDPSSGSPARSVSRKSVKPRAKVVLPPEPEDAADTSGQLAFRDDEESANTPPAPLAEPADPSTTPKPMPSLMDLADSKPTPRSDPPQNLNLDGVPGSIEPPPPDSEAPGLITDTSPAPSTPGDLVSGAKGASNPSPVDPASQPASEPSDPSANYNPFALVAAPPPEPSTTVSPGRPAAPARSNPASATDNSTSGNAPSSPPKPKKWSDLAQPASEVAAGVMVGTVATASASKNPSTTTATASASTRPSVLLARRSKGAGPTKSDAEAICQFDTKLNRLVDFQLPDLDGQPVRFRDFDADYVLLDFWGTWCEPCVGSIPHLIELQKKYGPTKLKVVGIACEKNPVDRRKAIVAAAAEKLGINYSVLVTGMDGNCPVQRDFQIQYYPTMILLDRRGKIVWRAEGATPSNLFRLDRALAATERPTQTARR